MNIQYYYLWRALPIGSAFLFATMHKIATVYGTSEKVLKKLIFLSTEKCGFFEKISTEKNVENLENKINIFIGRLIFI